jgi:hypothetical protein
MAGYTLTGRALAEPERLCGLEHRMRDSSCWLDRSERSIARNQRTAAAHSSITR